MDSLISLCKKNKDLKYVTIKNGKTSEIYFFRQKHQINKDYKFWICFIDPEETTVIFGHKASHRDINHVHTMANIYQEKALICDTPVLIVASYDGKPPMSFTLDDFKNLLDALKTQKNPDKIPIEA